MNYGFCFTENKYESVEISMEMGKIGQTFNPSELVSFNFKREKNIQDVRLKTD